MKYLKTSICLFALSVATNAAHAQTGSVSGTVTDAGSNEPLQSAAVFYLTDAGRTIGDATDPDGRYHLEIPAGESVDLVVRHVGYSEDVRVVEVSSGEMLEISFALRHESIDLNSVVVTVGRKVEKVLSAPAAISVVRTATIAADVSLSPVEAIENVPGVDIAQTGIAQWELSLRGLSDVFSIWPYPMIDYRRTSVPSGGFALYGIMPLVHLDLDRVEVVRGPASALWGPGVDRGAVHFVTRDPFTHPGLAVSLAGGQQSFTDIQARVAGPLGADNRWAYKLVGQLKSAEDWSLDPDDPFDAAEMGEDIFTRDLGVSKWSVAPTVGYRSGRTSAFLTGTATGYSGQMNSGLGTIRADDFRWFSAQLRINHGRSFFQVYGNRLDADQLYTYDFDGDENGLPDNLVLKDLSYGIQAQSRLPIQGGKGDLVFGLDAESLIPRTEGTLSGEKEDDDDVQIIGGYAQASYDPSARISLTAAVRADHATIFNELKWSPRAAVVFRPKPTQALRFSINQAYGAALPQNVYFDSVVGDLGGGVLLRRRGPIDGFSWQRDASYTAIAGSDLVMSSLLPGQVGAHTPVGMEGEALYQALLSAATSATFQEAMAAQGTAVDETAAAAFLSHLTAGSVAGFLPGAMAVLDLNTLEPTFVSELNDVKPAEPSRTQTLEVGYRAALGSRLALSGEVYASRITNLLGPTALETPLVFVSGTGEALQNALDDLVAENAQLAADLTTVGSTPAGFVSAVLDMAAQSGVILDGVPVGIVQPAENDAGEGAVPELLMTYRNYGELTYWGADISLEYVSPSGATGFANLSIVSDDYFDNEELGEEPEHLTLALNAPSFKLKGGVSTPLGRSFSGALSARYQNGFFAKSGRYVGSVDPYLLLDVAVGADLSRWAKGLRLDLSVKNALDNRHREFFGAPQIGRLSTIRLTVSL